MDAEGYSIDTRLIDAEITQSSRMVKMDTSFGDRVIRDEKSVHVTSEMIAAFCAAIGETNPLYTDPQAAAQGPNGGLVAPPSLAGSFGAAENVLQQLPQSKVRRLLAGIDVDFVLPIRPGDTITIASQVTDTYEKTGRSGSMLFIVFRSTLTNQHGKVAAHLDYRFVSRPKAKTASRGTAA